MNIMKVRCPECGEIVSADIDKAAAICEVCGAPFVTKDAIKAIQQYEGKSREANHPKVEEYLTSAKRALDNGLYDNAKMYYWKAAEYAPDSWEATFYKAFVEYEIIINNRASNSVNYYNTDAYLNDINKKTTEIYNAIKVAIDIVRNNPGYDILGIIEEIYQRLRPEFCDNRSIRKYILNPNNYKSKTTAYYHSYCIVSAKMFLYLGNVLEEFENRSVDYETLMLKYWKTGIEVLKQSYEDNSVDLFDAWEANSDAQEHIKLTRDFYNKAVLKIKKYDKSYDIKKLKLDKTNDVISSALGCWTSTAVLFVGIPIYRWIVDGGLTNFFAGLSLVIALPVCSIWLLVIICKWISRKI